MPLVKYIGAKEFKDDNVAGTGVVWLGNGDVQRVPYGAWAKLAKHPGEVVGILSSMAVAEALS